LGGNIKTGLKLSQSLSLSPRWKHTLNKADIFTTEAANYKGDNLISQNFELNKMFTMRGNTLNRIWSTNWFLPTWFFLWKVKQGLFGFLEVKILTSLWRISTVGRCALTTWNYPSCSQFYNFQKTKQTLFIFSKKKSLQKHTIGRS